MILILMGVSGSGKSTIGQALAQALNWEFIEGDRLHTNENIEKMSQGAALTDVDRWPWLRAIQHQIKAVQAANNSAVISCSALKRSYREFLCDGHPDNVQFIYLKGKKKTLLSRLGKRQGHFMKANMLNSQFATLEEPGNALIVNIDKPSSIEQSVAEICFQLGYCHKG